jgi:hypothetical protein
MSPQQIDRASSTILSPRLVRDSLQRVQREAPTALDAASERHFNDWIDRPGSVESPGGYSDCGRWARHAFATAHRRIEEATVRAKRKGPFAQPLADQ